LPSGGGADARPAAGSSTGTGQQRGDGTATTDGPAKTPAERRADIDGELAASLDRFDQTLRGEQQRAATERDSRAGARAAGAALDAAEQGGDADEIRRDRAGDLRSEGTKEQTVAKNNDAGGAGGSGSAEKQGGGGVAATPIPSGEDDDIVARRLRRAAEAETDPELKEKLWKEYRDYKENTRRAGS
jgi:hypothetical protein